MFLSPVVHPSKMPTFQISFEMFSSLMKNCSSFLNIFISSTTSLTRWIPFFFFFFCNPPSPSSIPWPPAGAQGNRSVVVIVENCEIAAAVLMILPRGSAQPQKHSYHFHPNELTHRCNASAKHVHRFASPDLVLALHLRDDNYCFGCFR